MKKLLFKHKVFLLRRSKREIQKRRKRKNKKYLNPFSHQPKNWYREKLPKFSSVLAPVNFSLRESDCVDAINLINQVKDLSVQKKNITILLDNVNYIGEGAIALLLSVINDCNTNGIYVRGTKPKNLEARQKLDRSGFFKYLRTYLSEDDLKTKNTFLRKGTEKTPCTSIAKEVHKAMETVWGVKSRCPLLTGGIIEMIRNSCDHAFWNQESITWYFGLSHYEESNHVKFAFVDNGKGIIKTLSEGLLKAFLNVFKDNADILDTAFKNGIKSRTGFSWRGKGLPTIFEMYEDNIIKRLVVITNNVYLDFDNNVKIILPCTYNGTYYYWEIDKQCHKSYFI